MNDRVFIDTNVLVMGYSFTEVDKQHIARKLIAGSNSFISTQVLQELANVLAKKFTFGYPEIIAAVEESCKNNNLHINSDQTIIGACRISNRFGYSFYDSLIISSALECKCSKLYSEDMQHGHVIEKSLEILNPFRAQ